MPRGLFCFDYFFPAPSIFFPFMWSALVGRYTGFCCKQSRAIKWHRRVRPPLTSTPSHGGRGKEWVWVWSPSRGLNQAEEVFVIRLPSTALHWPRRCGREIGCVERQQQQYLKWTCLFLVETHATIPPWGLRSSDWEITKCWSSKLLVRVCILLVYGSRLTFTDGHTVVSWDRAWLGLELNVIKHSDEKVLLLHQFYTQCLYTHAHTFSIAF